MQPNNNDFRAYTTPKQLTAYIQMVIRRLEIDLDAQAHGIKVPKTIRRKK